MSICPTTSILTMHKDFYADLSEGTTGNFEIEPQSGTLNKRGGEPQVITVRWKGGAGAGGHLVVQVFTVCIYLLSIEKNKNHSDIQGSATHTSPSFLRPITVYS